MAEPQRAYAPPDVEASETAGPEEVATPSSGATKLNGAMSDEERERRQRVRDKIFAACNDKCKRFYDNPRFRSKLMPCRENCSRDKEECRKEIP